MGDGLLRAYKSAGTNWSATMRLYSYFRSSAAYRVRIVLNLKGLRFETMPVHMLRGGGEQHHPEYSRIHPLRLVPSLEIDGLPLTQSLAICEYLEERWPTPPILPIGPAARARVRAIAAAIACDVHPLNNLRALKYLVADLGANEDQKLAWYRHWISLGLEGVERMLADSQATGTYCHGDMPTLADTFLVPQVSNALRYHCSTDAYPTTTRIYNHCLKHPAFFSASPDQQPDRE
jgi:maleylacetoacetate isomerase